MILTVDDPDAAFARALSAGATAASLGGALNAPTCAGWTGKEMLAHVAFWDEAVVPAVVTMFRGQNLPPDWAFGSGDLGLGDGEWPAADVHNAREAAWARTRPLTDVIERCDRAHHRLAALLKSVTDGEYADHAGYFAGLGAHYDEHLAELATSAAGRSLVDSERDPPA